MTFADQSNSAAVGDLPGYGEDAYFDEDAAYAESNYVSPASHASVSRMQSLANQPSAYAPVGAAELQPGAVQPVGLQRLASTSCGGACGGSCSGGCEVAYGGGCCDSGCGVSSCDGGCDSYGHQKRKICGIFDSCGHNTWAQAEMLLWFTPDRDMPALVTTSNPGSFPIIPHAGQPNPNNVQVVFGDDIEGELSAGFRLDLGMWLTDNVGVGGRFWALAENNDSYFGIGDGGINGTPSTSIGIPFFATDINNNDAVIINRDGSAAVGDSGFAGFVGAESELEVYGAELYSRVRFSCSKTCRLDFIGGYSHFEIDDTLRMLSARVNVENPATLRTRTYDDFFECKNQFDGGQVGFEMVITRGRWMARSLTKVHLGNMQQRVTIAGVSTDDPDGPGAGATTVTSGGIFAQGNQGVYERDVFSFAPEANFKLGYRLRDNMLLSVGYSFIYWDNVALNGDVIDNEISNILNLNTGAPSLPRPEFAFDDSSLWVQGLDLGVIIDF